MRVQLVPKGTLIDIKSNGLQPPAVVRDKLGSWNEEIAAEDLFVSIVARLCPFRVRTDDIP